MYERCKYPWHGMCLCVIQRQQNERVNLKPECCGFSLLWKRDFRILKMSLLPRIHVL